MRISLAMMLAAAITLSCQDPLDIDGLRPATAVEVAHALESYIDVAACLALPDEGDRVRWWVAEAIEQHGIELAGAGRKDDIYILERAAATPDIWRHESMHHVLRYGRGDPDSRHVHAEWGHCAPR